MTEHHHSYSEVWKHFEEQPLTHSMAHYLLAVSELRSECGYARVTNVAKKLGVTKGSASIALKAIREKGFLAEDEHRMLNFTPCGKAAVENVAGSRTAFLRFFREILAIDEQTALEDSCKLEHLVSHISTERLIRFMECSAASTPMMTFLRDFQKSFRPATGKIKRIK